MADKFLNYTQLQTFLNKLKDKFATKAVVTTSSDGLMAANDKTKLNGIATGANVNVQSDWNATTGDAFIKNKPTIPTTTSSVTSGSTAALTSGGAYTALNNKVDKITAITAKTTQAVYPVTINAQGQITGSGNAVTIPTTTSSVTSGSTAALTSGGAYTALQGKENTTNKSTNITSSSTDTQYASAKAVYTYVNSAIGNAIESGY